MPAQHPGVEIEIPKRIDGHWACGGNQTPIFFRRQGSPSALIARLSSQKDHTLRWKCGQTLPNRCHRCIFDQHDLIAVAVLKHDGRFNYFGKALTTKIFCREHEDERMRSGLHLERQGHRRRKVNLLIDASHVVYARQHQWPERVETTEDDGHIGEKRGPLLHGKSKGCVIRNNDEVELIATILTRQRDREQIQVFRVRKTTRVQILNRQLDLSRCSGEASAQTLFKLIAPRIATMVRVEQEDVRGRCSIGRTARLGKGGAR